jgi:NADPH-dependent 2,4-dienoyl-CoA reductase/sulfur reductase-like enzyme
VFAIGAKCTHYGGPLGEGLIEGDTVRCPWHHACFSLRTGEAVGAPALNAVDCFEVSERAGKLYVLGQKPLPKPAAPAVSPSSVVLVGAGPASNAAAERLRVLGYAGPITLVGADDSVPYDRPNLSKDYLAGNAPEEWIPLRSEEFYAEKNIQLLKSTRVTAIDVKAKSVTLDGGKTLSYGALLLATGASPVVLDLPGARLPHVHTLRSLTDSRALIAAAEKAKRAVVIGASFIGLEVAASLRARGLSVDVVGPEPLPLARILGPELGGVIRRIHESHGVTFHLGTKPARIDEQSVTLENGETIEAQLVVLGVGVRPNLELAEGAGLKLHRGVVVDRFLRTSAPDVYAAGDVARYEDVRTGETPRIEHFVVAERQGQCVAQNMLGAERAFDDVPFFWSAHYDVTLSYVGHAEGWDHIDVTGSLEQHDCAVAYRHSGRTLAVATLGRDRVSLEADVALQRGDEKKLRELVPG